MAKGDICVVCGDDYKARKSSYESEYKGKALCNKHSLQIKRNGRIVDPLPSRRRDDRKCEVCGDNHKVRLNRSYKGDYLGKLLCSKHYNQIRLKDEITDPNPGNITENRICSVCGEKDGKIIYHIPHGKMYCLRHYSQIKNLGRIYKRTVNDPNGIIIKEDYAEVLLYNVNHEVIAKAKIDIDDIELVSKYKWGLNGNGYATTTIGGVSSVGMHKIITNTRETIVDHINRDGLDNRKSNLTLSNKSRNAINADLRSNNNSGVTGVSFSKSLGKWRTYINYRGNRLELGYFDAFDDAVRCRLNAELRYYPENPPQKNLFEKYNIKRGDMLA